VVRSRKTAVRVHSKVQILSQEQTAVARQSASKQMNFCDQTVDGSFSDIPLVWGREWFDSNALG